MCEYGSFVWIRSLLRVHESLECDFCIDRRTHEPFELKREIDLGAAKDKITHKRDVLMHRRDLQTFKKKRFHPQE